MKKFLLACMALTAMVLTSSAQEQEDPLLTIGCLTDFHIEGRFLNYANPGHPEGVRLRQTTTKAIEGMKKENVDMLLLGGDYTSLTTVDRTNWNQAKQMLVDTLHAVFGDRQYKPVVYVTGNHEYQAPGDGGNKWFSGSAGSTKSWNSADYYTYPMKEDLGELSADECFYETAGGMQILAAFHYNILGVDVVAMNTASTFYENASSYQYTMESAKWCVNKVDELYKENPDRTVFFIAHVPFNDSNSLSTNKGQKKDNGSADYLLKGLAKHPSLIMLYGHDHGGDNAMTQVKTSQRVTRYNTSGTKIATTDSTHVDGTMPGDVYVSPSAGGFTPIYCLQNVASGLYLGKNADDKGADGNYLNMMATPAEIKATSSGVSIPHNGSTYYLSCNTSGNFSAKTSGSSYIYEISADDLNASSITGKKVTSMTDGKYYIITGNGYVLGNTASTDNPSYKRVVGVKQSGYSDGAASITLTQSNNKAYIYQYIYLTEAPKPTVAPGQESFFSEFMGSLRYHTDNINPNGDYDDTYENEPIVVQGLVIKLYSDRIEFRIKNYGYTGTKNGITIEKEPAPYTVFRNVKLYTPTSVNGVRSDAKSGKTYNLFGQEVGADYKGLAIRDGRKVLIR